VRKLIGYNIIEQSDFDTAQLQNEGEARVTTTLQEQEKEEVEVKVKVEDKKSLKSITKEYRRDLQLQKKYIDVDVEIEFERYANWLASKGKKLKDYRAGFRNWLVSPFVEKTDKIRQKIRADKILEDQRQSRVREETQNPEEFKPPKDFLDFVNNFGRKTLTTETKEESNGQ
jgi:hypothetical protein